MDMAVTHVHGKDVGHIMLFALSTCGWCAKTRKLLEDLGVAYDYEYVDLLKGEERNKVAKVVEKWNPAGSFPVIVLKDKKCIIGFKEDDIRKALAK
jgi:glutaredoxin-like protein NrdH